MDTRYLKTLVTTIEVGSFSKAASVLHLTQSAVSQRVKFLEERFGHQLIDRTGNRLVLTSAGEVVVDAAYRVLAIQDNLIRDLQRIDDKERISLCCTPTFGTVYLPGVLNAFMLENNSTVDLKFLFYSPDQAVEGVRNQEFDLAVVEHCGDTDLSMFRTHKLPDDELVFVSAPELGLPAPDLDLETLLQMRLFARKDGCSSKKLVRSGLTKLGRELEDFSGVVISDDLRLTCQTVIAGGGVSFMSKSLVESHLEAGRLVAHYVEGFTHRRCRTVIFNPEQEENRLLQSFVNCIFSVLQMDGPYPLSSPF